MKRILTEKLTKCVEARLTKARLKLLSEIMFPACVALKKDQNEKRREDLELGRQKSAETACIAPGNAPGAQVLVILPGELKRQAS